MFLQILCSVLLVCILPNGMRTSQQRKVNIKSCVCMNSAVSLTKNEGDLFTYCRNIGLNRMCLRTQSRFVRALNNVAVKPNHFDSNVEWFGMQRIFMTFSQNMKCHTIWELFCNAIDRIDCMSLCLSGCVCASLKTTIKTIFSSDSKVGETHTFDDWMREIYSYIQYIPPSQLECIYGLAHVIRAISHERKIKRKMSTVVVNGSTHNSLAGIVCAVDFIVLFMFHFINARTIRACFAPSNTDTHFFFWQTNNITENSRLHQWTPSEASQ